MQYDVFNGDADGICALHQLRLAQPRPNAILVTGVKRDIALLSQLTDKVSAGDDVTVLDISMATNMAALGEILAKGCNVLYADHHYAGDPPISAYLTAHIDTSSDVCTSLIINTLLVGRYPAWAVTAAFGDNLHGAARKMADDVGLSQNDTADLRELGELMNYNGYGASLADLHLTPQALYEAVQPFSDPLEFFRDSPDLAKLRAGFAEDMANAHENGPVRESVAGRVYRFPDAAWSKRVAGVFSNEKAREKIDLAHALLVDNGDGTFMASVRAPISRKEGADLLCRSFPTGGGRTAAAGINALPEGMVDEFFGKFEELFTP